MRRIIGGVFQSLDGIIQAPGGPTEDPTGGFVYGGWMPAVSDEAVGQAVGNFFSLPYDLLLGRRTYEIFAAYWPYATGEGAAMGEAFTAAAKYVLTRGEQPLAWENSRRLRNIDDLAALKQSDAGPTRLIPSDAGAAVGVRQLDRVFDNYVMNVMQVIVSDALRPEASRDPYGVERARADLDRIYAWLDRELAAREWATGRDFTLADCAAAPSLFYADWVHPIAERYPTLKAYRARLLARPSVSRCVEEARPYRAYFPLGTPDRD